MIAPWRRVAGLLVLASAAACGEPASDTPRATTAAGGDAAAFWALFRQAGEARRRGDRGAALLGYESALQRQPGHGDSLYYIAQLRYERGQIELARRRLLELAEIEPRGVRVWQQLSVVDGTPLAGWLPDLRGAMAAAEQAQELHPSESRNHYLAARWAAYAGDFRAASDLLDTAVGHNPRLWAAHLLRIWIAIASGDTTTAVTTRDGLLRQMCGDDGSRCADFDPAREFAAAAAVAPRAGIAEESLAGAVRPLDIDGDGLADARVVLGAGDDVLLLPVAARMNAGSGPRPIPSDAVALSGAGQPALVVVGGGDVAVRAFTLSGDAYRLLAPASLAGHAVDLTLPVITAGDVDGDGLDEVLLANLPQPDGTLGGLLLRGLANGAFEPAQHVPGPLSAAHIADLDGDGDLDLLIARDTRATLLATSALERVVGSEPPDAAPAPVLTLWRNHEGRLQPSDTSLPPLWSPVRSLATLDADRDGRLDLLVATGDLAPERPAPDRLWLQTADGFAEASDRLGDAAFGATLRAWPDAAGAIILVRGGLVPGDPRRLVRVPMR